MGIKSGPDVIENLGMLVEDHFVWLKKILHDEKPSKGAPDFIRMLFTSYLVKTRIPRFDNIIKAIPWEEDLPKFMEFLLVEDRISGSFLKQLSRKTVCRLFPKALAYFDFNGNEVGINSNGLLKDSKPRRTMTIME